MGQISIPVVDIEGQLLDSYFTLLPREGKKDIVSGKIRVQAHLKVCIILQFIIDINQLIFFFEKIVDNIKGEKEVRYLDLIDKDAASKLDKTQLAQQEIIFQLVQTEQKYLQDLNDIFKVSMTIFRYYYHKINVAD